MILSFSFYTEELVLSATPSLGFVTRNHRRRRNGGKKEKKKSVNVIHYLGRARWIYPPLCFSAQKFEQSPFFKQRYRSDRGAASLCQSPLVMMCVRCVALQRVCAPSLLLQYASQQGPGRISNKAHKQVSPH